jgi:four helix bundle protein
MGAKSFRDLIVWQLARELRCALRPLWRKAAAVHDYRLQDQLRSAARSVTANVAEGFKCSHVENARFLEVASRSLEEIEDRLIEMLDDELITGDDAKLPLRLKMRTSRAIASFRNYLLSTPDPPSYKPGAKRRKRTRRTDRT